MSSLTPSFVVVDGCSYSWDGSPVTIYQFLSQKGIIIPCFCYHEKLSIAGNCRMCLVEANNALVVSCAMPLVPQMVIVTVSERIEQSRENILEFLLANHPLDCPICDQGGECDLQDISKTYGLDRGRFYEEKRAVDNLGCFGPLVKTIMVRCIHCTRCIRFLREKCDSRFFGSIGRGVAMEIGSFLSSPFIADPLSANIIDICPVGALTSMSSAFAARPWECKTIESIDIFDSLASSVRLDVAHNKIVRCLPLVDENLNEDWITNKARFVYRSIQRQQLLTPQRRINGRFVPISWEESADLIFSTLAKNYLFAGHAGNFVDLETGVFFKSICKILGNVIPRHEGVPFVRMDYKQLFLLNNQLPELEKASMILLIGSDLRYESPLVHVRFRKTYLLKKGERNPFRAFALGSGIAYSKFPITQLGSTLSDIDKLTRWELNGMQDFLFNPWSLFLGSSLQLPRHLRPRVILGSAVLRLAQASEIQARLWNFCSHWQRKLPAPFCEERIYNALPDFLGKITMLMLGCSETSAYGKGSSQLPVSGETQKLFPTIHYHLMTENPAFSRRTKDDLLVYQGCVCPADSDIDLYLPVATPLERRSFYVNALGLVRSTNVALSSLETTLTDPQVFQFLFGYGLQLYLKEKTPSLEGFFNAEGLFPWKAGTLFEGLKNEYGIDLLNRTVTMEQIPDELPTDSAPLEHFVIGNYNDPYYESDVLSRNCPVMARCATLVDNSNFSELDPERERSQ